jgi:hypothetical protein
MEKAEGQPRRPPHRRKQYLEHGGRASRRLCTPGSMFCAICRARAAIGTSSNRHHRSRRAKIPNSIGQDDENAIVDTSVVVELGGALASRWLPSRRRTCGGWGGVINAARRLWRIRGNRNDLHALEDRLFA